MRKIPLCRPSQLTRVLAYYVFVTPNDVEVKDIGNNHQLLLTSERERDREKERERQRERLFTSRCKHEILSMKWFCQNIKPDFDQTSKSTSQFTGEKVSNKQKHINRHMGM